MGHLIFILSTEERVHLGRGRISVEYMDEWKMSDSLRDLRKTCVSFCAFSFGYCSLWHDSYHHKGLCGRRYGLLPSQPN